MTPFFPFNFRSYRVPFEGGAVCVCDGKGYCAIVTRDGITDVHVMVATFDYHIEGDRMGPDGFLSGLDLPQYQKLGDLLRDKMQNDETLKEGLFRNQIKPIDTISG